MCIRVAESIENKLRQLSSSSSFQKGRLSHPLLYPVRSSSICVRSSVRLLVAYSVDCFLSFFLAAAAAAAVCVLFDKRPTQQQQQQQRGG